ncbi:hypothetical protein [Sphingomonas sp.]|uniref:hypothetical protein n=1 Tax=Sphingomonas sp. TaxID=28214 RepID=UPI0028AC150B|nr:hypothetical protein [Sphingomonas sp.]
MTPFLELVNDNGVTVVDDRYTCLALRQWGNGWALAMPSFNYPPGGVRTQDITYAGGTAPVMAVYKAANQSRLDGGAGVIGRSYNPATNTWTFRVMVVSSPTWGEDYSFSYYIFDQPLPLVAGEVGAELFDGAGRCLFSSSLHQMIMRPAGAALSSAKWAHTFPGGVGVQNETYDVSDGSGSISFRDRYTISLSTWGSSPTSVFNVPRTYSQDNSRENWVPSGLEANSSEGSFLVDVSRIR